MEAGGFMHSQGGGIGDCRYCHNSTNSLNGKSWAPGVWTHNPHPTECSSCHGKDTSLQATLKMTVRQMNHASVSPFPDCAVCHAASGAAGKWTTWAVDTQNPADGGPVNVLGAFHKNVTTVTTCIQCHASQRPALPVGLSHFNHVAKGALGDCSSCHGLNPPSIGLTWAIPSL
ncbi:MAG: hypothetical protein C5B49_06300 [Bdellovibrio sp.]|nr:MAG: hypothetical protein C5B49_06300 [Bdellovibrio sp.]